MQRLSAAVSQSGRQNLRLDTYADPNSIAKVQVLFVSEAPPGGRTIGDFFHIPKTEDGLRKKLFIALSHTNWFHDITKMPNQKGLESFFRGGLYLLPSFNYPCSKRDPESGEILPKNANPTFEQLSHSSEHLQDEVSFIQPPVIFALGKSALFTLLQAYGNSTSEARRLESSITRTTRIGPYIGSTFSIKHGSKCEVRIENWPRIASMKRQGFKRLVQDLQNVLDARYR